MRTVVVTGWKRLERKSTRRRRGGTTGSGLAAERGIGVQRVEAVPVPAQARDGSHRQSRHAKKLSGPRRFCRLRSCSGGLCAKLHKEGGALAKKAAELYTEPMGWIEEQFRAAGHEKDSRELAVHLFCAFQGMAAVAHGANDPDVVVMEVKRLKDWIRTL